MPVAGVRMMEAVLCPLLHKKEEPPVTVRVVVLPKQRDVLGLALMTAVIVLLTVTVATALAEQIPLVTSTV